MTSQASAKDIEELAEVGRMTQTCPYFGSRRAIPQAEVCVLFREDSVTRPTFVFFQVSGASLQPTVAKISPRCTRD